MKKAKREIVDYNEFLETLSDEWCYTLIENHSQGDEDGNADPFIMFTIKTLYNAGVKDTDTMMEVILPMLEARLNHLTKLGNVVQHEVEDKITLMAVYASGDNSPLAEDYEF